MAAGETGNIVLYCSPRRSHMVPIVELAKLLVTHHPASSVVVITAAPEQTPPAAESIISASAAAIPSLRLLRLPPISIPGDFPPPNSPAAAFELARLRNPGLLRVLQVQVPGIRAFIMDMFCNPAFLVCYELNIPAYYLFPAGALVLSALLPLSRIHDTVDESVKELPDGLFVIPGMPRVRTSDLPIHARDRTSRAYPDFVDWSRNMVRSAGIIMNTFESLEPITVKAIREGKCVTGGPNLPIYCVGPLINSGGGGGQVGGDRHHSLSWLDSQPSGSVLFLSFGSAGFAFSAEQITEIAVGLERSGVGFLWLASPPRGSTAALESFLPEGFTGKTKARGLVLDSWAPQVEILGHGSIGGFVTHCGWNSVLEAIKAGMPMLAWPLYAEQKINRVALVEEMGVALPVAESEDGIVSAGELEKKVVELMRPDKREAMRERVAKLRAEAAAAMSDGGSSVAALAELVESTRLKREIDIITQVNG